MVLFFCQLSLNLFPFQDFKIPEFLSFIILDEFWFVQIKMKKEKLVTRGLLFG